MVQTAFTSQCQMELARNFCTDCIFLLPKWRDQLKVACNFIANMWAQAWFSNQHYSENVYDELFSAVSELKCSKAVNCFSTHWKREPSVLEVPRSNIVAERGVKLMEELHFLYFFFISGFGI